MKRVVNGVTYDTNTATVLARQEWDNGEGEDRGVQTLYQTRGGAFFGWTDGEKTVWNQRAQEKQQRPFTECLPMSPEEAQAWITEGDDVELLHNPFGELPEAAAEAEPGATIYLRLPASLKARVDKAAEKQALSINAYAMKCLERCLAQTAAE
jgi:hypothetical protein